MAGATQAESGTFWEFTGGLWTVPDADGFKVYDGGVWYEEYDASIAFAANAKFGYEFDMESGIADVAGLAGWYAGPIMGLTLGADTSYRFKFGESGGFTIGPHAGVNYYALPTWIGDYDEYVDFDETVGGVLGIKATFGSRKVRGVLTIDYVAAKFDASPSSGGGPSSSELDMGGFLIQGGVQF
jgi:hypothetical protein